MTREAERLILTACASVAIAIVVTAFASFFSGCAGLKLPRTCIEVGSSDAGADADGGH
jgi:hypothetical protein